MQAAFLYNLAHSLFSKHPHHLLSVVNELPHCVHCVLPLCHLGSLLPAPGRVQPAVAESSLGCRAEGYIYMPTLLASQSRCRNLRDGPGTYKAYSSTCPSSESSLLSLSLATLNSRGRAFPVTTDQTESSQKLKPAHDCRDGGKRDLNEGLWVPLSFVGLSN